MPEDVAEFIANHLKNNIRQLEGAVKKLNAYYMLEGIQPVISVAQNAIKYSKLQEGLADIDAGNTRPFADVMADLRHRRERR